MCDDYLNAHPASRDVFTSATLSDCIMSVLESGGAEQNQEDLLNLLGMDSVEFVFTVMQHRDALLHAPDAGSSPAPPASTPSAESAPPSSTPIDNLGLPSTYLSQLKDQGLRLQGQPRGYLPGVKLSHSITTDERISGTKSFHDVGVFPR